jgi:GTPase
VSERLCPIFQISNVTGEGLNLVRNFLNILPSQAKYDSSLPFEYQITDTFSVPFVGTVVSGVVISGVAHIGDSLLLGPDSLGHFIPTAIKGIQRKRVNVPAASAGQGVTLALKRIRRSQIRKGMVMLSHDKDAPMPKACRQFEAEVLVLYHSTTIGQKYQAMVHCGSVRQTARIVNLDQTVLRTGDRATVVCTFLIP